MGLQSLAENLTRRHKGTDTSEVTVIGASQLGQTARRKRHRSEGTEFRNVMLATPKTFPLPSYGNIWGGESEESRLCGNSGNRRPGSGFFWVHTRACRIGQSLWQIACKWSCRLHFSVQQLLKPFFPTSNLFGANSLITTWVCGLQYRS